MKPLEVALVLAFLVGTASADTVNIPLGAQPPNTAEGMPRPTRGMTMDAVVERFGEPAKRLPAVGEPPITRWIYDRFTVYFEGERAVHAVVNRKAVPEPPG